MAGEGAVAAAPPAEPAAPAPAPDPAAPQPGSDPDVQQAAQRLAGSDAFAALDAMGGDDEPPAPKKVTPPKDPQTGQFTKKPAEKPKPAAPAAAPKPDPAPTGEDAPVKASELRVHYDKLKKEAVEREERHKREKADWEKQLTEARNGDKTWTEKHSALQKQFDEAQSELRFTKYEASNEYKEKYQKPYVDAYSAGMKKTAALKVIERWDDSDPTNKVKVQEKRQGTPEDFDAIMSIADDDAAAERAVQLFGQNNAAMVLWHRENAMGKATVAREAIKEYREKGAAWDKDRTEKQSAQQKQATEMVEKMQAHAADRFPQFFKPTEGDDKGNQLLESGNHLVKRIIAGGAPLAEGETQWTSEEFALNVAAYRNKAGGFDRVAHQVTQLRKEVKELKGKLAAYEDSEPGADDGKGAKETPTGAPAAAGGKTNWETDLESRAQERAA